ncbi:MAG: 4Fe-4S binding protein [Coriobacteriales bacterium]|jgi:ferredoxin-type protein NapH|nr:4Fe-4S binding protein [Coriobacteriales bacterium]
MRIASLRVLVALAVIALITIGFVTNIGIGTLSSFGWSDISILCPLGALTTMLGAKILVPRALIALVIVVILIVLVGRAFCSWVCPVPLLQKLRAVFRKDSKLTTPDEESTVGTGDTDTTATCRSAASLKTQSTAPPRVAGKAEKASLCHSNGDASNCSSCAQKRGTLDPRHFVLGGSLLSAALFGFPVFCLICPIGLSFAAILLVVRLFSEGDLTWSIVIVLLLLTVEVLIFRKWCSQICPLSAFMSLLAKVNRTFRPAINKATCLETAKGIDCGLCAKACPEDIDPRHPKRSYAPMSECTKCLECAKACPTKALRLPFLPGSRANGAGSDDSGGLGGSGGPNTSEQERAA